jgi:hypothetical protein
MRAIELTGSVDDQHQLNVQVPEDFPAGPVRVIVLFEDETGAAWAKGIAREWADDLADLRQDIYTLEDGQPVDAVR